MATERRIKSLKMRLRSIETSFNLIKVFVENFDEETQSNEVPVRLENLAVLWADFGKTQAELEAADVDDNAVMEHQLKQRAQFETDYYRVKGFLLSVNKSTSPSSHSCHSSAHFPTSSQIRLPDVKLPVFNGALENWLNFHDLFISLVHSSTELSNIQKFYYLRSSLAGDALKLVQTIAISANNYPVAWNLLIDHFQNPARLKQAYVDSLFEFAPLKKESASDLHSLVERFEANVRILKQLGERTEFWDVLLIRMLSIRLDPTTRRDWEEFSSTHEAATFPDLVSFLQRRVTVLQSVSNVHLDTSSSSAPKKPVHRSAIISNGATQFSPRQCFACSEHHPLYLCQTFAKMTIEDKDKLVRRQQLCRNCLRKGHQSRSCQSKNCCRKCRGRHHSQLCSTSTSQGESSKPRPEGNTSRDSNPTSQEVSSLSAAVGKLPKKGHPNKVLLATAVIKLTDDYGNTHFARALLDSGSECNFITESFAQKLKVRRTKVHLSISGIGQSSTQSRSKLRTTIHSRVTGFSTIVELLVLPKLTLSLPSATLDISSWKLPKEIQLADPNFYQSNPIDIVLGAEIFFDLFKPPGRIPLGDSLPVLVNSVLGWVVSGKVTNSTATSSVIANLATVADIYRLMQRFWIIEEADSAPCMSVEEAACEKHFSQNVQRTPEGRYIVRLPFKEPVSSVGDNRSIAQRRFRMVESRLQRDTNLQAQYHDFMAEYVTLGHMQRVDTSTPPTQQYYLPHHAVIREDSSTTKVRVVFDASCKSGSGKSLNDVLMVGAVIQDDLRSIILRTRINPVLLIADIQKMYRQILVDERDTPLQRILWRSSPNEPVSTFELKTVTYGTASAPFLATRTLQQLADDEKADFPLGAAILKRDVYVDDLVTSGRTPEELAEVRNQLDQLCRRGGFEFRKFASNIESVLDGIPSERRALQSSVELAADQTIKTLGLHWEPASDHFRFQIRLPEHSRDVVLSKRLALSQIAQLFDPLGLVGPVIVTAKMFMQTLWSLNSDDGKPWGWDQPLPPSLTTYWQNYYAQLPVLDQLRIPRCVVLPEFESIQLHLFSDASENAYGACAYFRSKDSSGCISVGLLTAKSKVAPLKKRSIPRLELCGALEAAQLYQKISSTFGRKFETFFWVDSTTVLAWLKATPSVWTTFVANRVSKIQLATVGASWNHVAGQENPADHLSRGIDAKTLISCKLWWNGPNWLRSDDFLQLTSPSSTSYETHLEFRTSKPVGLTASADSSFIDTFVGRFSKYQTMLRVTAFCLRLSRKSRSAEARKRSFLSATEIRDAENALIRLVQAQEFSEHVAALQASKPAPIRSQLRWFTPFLDADRLMRVGGRIDKSALNYDAKHQILLPYNHRFSALLVECLHERHLHAAPQLLLGILRLRYWITGARKLAKTIVHRCIICVRARPKLVEQFMAELPKERVIAARPFSVSGVDYWGPILLKPPHRRSAPIKAFVAVFVCFTTKAVHIELVFDLTTAKFIQALRRFVSRRGPPSDIYSDNGRNFLGASNELRKLLRSSDHAQGVASECSDSNIRWHFNPPRASHFGGLWESAINSAQKHFLRVVRDRPLAYDDMDTLLCQIECCLNSRPLTPLSDDPTDFEPLTPGHFLVGTSLKSVPDENYNDIPSNYLRKWQQTQKLLQDIWRRWHLEYLSSLVQRSKWFNSPVTLKENQLVLLKEDGIPPIRWPTARISKLHPGTDGITRVVTLQTPKGSCTRPVAKVCLLPIASSAEEIKKPLAADQ
ncbi:uncharacterized protein LOC129737660 [Uranotaenia lowii]|uniref:uncharacterized protein LOC129737660 n=1 Tax=Uranotaenia lowii TaxID=190385 RepID=UPI002479B939|nr:uncharacterized protein LOC129737660 [Uranotaenia lowii]